MQNNGGENNEFKAPIHKHNEKPKTAPDSQGRVQEILQTLERMYPGKVRVSITETATALGLARGTIYNGISRRSSKPFPIKVVRVGGKPGFLITDIAKH